MERQREDLVHQYSMEKEDMTAATERLKDELTNELAMLQRDRDDSLLLAENEKQQVRHTFPKLVEIPTISLQCSYCCPRIGFSALSAKIYF